MVVILDGPQETQVHMCPTCCCSPPPPPPPPTSSPQVVQAVKGGKYPFVMCNFAPPDMVGHTGVYDAAVIACATTGER